MLKVRWRLVGLLLSLNRVGGGLLLSAHGPVNIAADGPLRSDDLSWVPVTNVKWKGRTNPTHPLHTSTCVPRHVLHGTHVHQQNDTRNTKLLSLNNSSGSRSNGNTLVILALGGQRQEDSCECKARLIYCSSSSTARAIFQDFSK